MTQREGEKKRKTWQNSFVFEKVLVEIITRQKKRPSSDGYKKKRGGGGSTWSISSKQVSK